LAELGERRDASRGSILGFPLVRGSLFATVAAIAEASSRRRERDYEKACHNHNNNNKF